MGRHRKQLRAFRENSWIPAGKAPRAVIDKRFRKEIQDELTKKLVSKSYHEAVEQEQLRVASLTNIEDIEFGEDKSMRFRATVVTAPEFELPDYKNIPVQLPDTKVSEAEVEAAIERLRDQSADFVDVPERALQMGDFAVLDFEGSIEDKPISEIAPQASKNLHGGKKFWLHLAPENFLPKFCEQLIGLKPGETRLVIVDFPDGFPSKGTGRQKSRLRGYIARDQGEGVAADRRCARGQAGPRQNAGCSSRNDRARPRTCQRA